MKCLDEISDDEIVCNKKGCIEAIRSFSKALKRQRRSDQMQMSMKLNKVTVTKEEHDEDNKSGSI